MKQTAVEWLIEQYENDFPLTFDAMEQAKAMEKEQIEDARNEGYGQGWDEGANYVAKYM